MHSRCPRLFLSVALLAALVGHAPADVVTIPADRDNTLYQDTSGVFSNGAGDHVFVGNSNQQPGFQRKRALVRFDVASAVPPGSVVNSVTLLFNLSRTRDGDPQMVQVHRLTADWGEAGSHAPGSEGGGTGAQSGDATWFHRFTPTQTWNTPGGDFAAAPSASVTMAAAGPVTIASTPALVSDVQAFVDAASTNFGWILIGDESTSQTAKRLDSHDNGSAANRPMLIVDFTPPVPPGISCRGSRVNAGAGSPVNVLFVNGSTGDSQRVVIVAPGSPLQVAMQPSPSGPNPGPFVMYLHFGEPSGSTVTPLPRNLGLFCFPIPVTGGGPQPRKIWNNIGRFRKLGFPDFPSTPAPSFPVFAPQGTNRMATVTLQAILADNGSSAAGPASISNAVILKIQ